MSKLASLFCIAVICTLLLSACGSSSKLKTDVAGHSQALEFSNCMRAHGVPNFPDPTSGGGVELNGSGVDPRSPSFRSAQKACARFQTGGGFPRMSESEKRAALTFAECMRTNGEPNFPDPTLTAPTGTTTVLVLRGMVFAFPHPINPQAPAFKRAASACGFRTPGSG